MFYHIKLILDYRKFIIELQALGMIGTSCKLAPAGAVAGRQAPPLILHTLKEGIFTIGTASCAVATKQP